MTQQVIDYFSRLTGKAHTGDTPISLTSAQAGAALSWMRRSGLTFSEQRLLSKMFTVTELLATDAPTGVGGQSITAARPPGHLAAAAGMTTGLPGLGSTGLGIDIESLSAMPVCVDYREHPFYVDHFTDAEIAYCICQPNPRQSFCGLWAAKEAVLKATGARAHRNGLRAIEISHDDDGRPTTASALLSISHAGESCVAVAFRPGDERAEMSSGFVTGDERSVSALAEQDPGSGGRSRMLVGSMVTATGLVCAALGFTIGQMPW